MIPFNLYTASAYVVHSIPVLDTFTYIKSAPTASKLFVEIKSLIIKRTVPFFVGYLRAHSGLGGSLSRGNALADGAIRPTFSTLLDSIDLAKWAHALHHLNAKCSRFLEIKQEKLLSPVVDVPLCCWFLT